MARRNLSLTALAAAGALVGGVSALTFVSYQRDIRRAREHSTGSQIVQTTAGPIEYAVMGEGPPVLIVHGAGGGYYQCLDFIRPMVNNGFRFITMSRFGYLRTPLPADASAAAQADAHARLLDTLNISEAAVVGISAGAPSAMQFAARHPGRCVSMTLLAPLAYAPRPREERRQPSAMIRALSETVLRSDFLFWLAMKTIRQTLIRTLLATPLDVVTGASVDEQRRIVRWTHSVGQIGGRVKSGPRCSHYCRCWDN
jgi:pimeloyl-ACP methyl ester carboxylesterase